MKQRLEQAFPLLASHEVLRWAPYAHKQGIGTTAATRDFGFALQQASRRKGELELLWQKRRLEHLRKQISLIVKNDEAWFVTDDQGRTLPSGRHLGMICWAFSPEPIKLSRLSPP